ncbi:hypothetical protein JZU46_00995 [bacterium]|nr:hypothetical protein [bacterium]
MCEIYGFTILSGKFEESLGKTQLITLFNNLALLSCGKGHDATGITIVNDNKVDVLKRNVPPTKLLTTSEYLKFLSGKLDPANTYSVFGQTKNKAAGTSLAGKDNYPIIANTVIGMYDGTLINNEEIFEEFGKLFSKDTKAEGEAAFKMYDYYKHTLEWTMQTSLKKMHERIKGFSNFIFVDAFSPSTVYVVKKSTNPINIFFYKKAGIVVYASSDECITKAAKLVGLYDEEKILLPMGYSAIICAKTNTFEKLLL